MAQLSRPPRIAILSTSASIGGQERNVCGLSHELINRGWQVHTVFPVSENRAALLQWCHDQNMNAEVSTALLDATARHSSSSIVRLRDFVRNLRPDIVNIQYGENYISLKDLIAIRTAGSHRCVVTVNHPRPWAEMNRKKKLMTTLAGGLAHQVVTISRAGYKVLREAAIPAKRLHVIPCGVRPPKHLIDCDTARRALGLPVNALLIGSLARLVSHKGNDDLIKAVAHINIKRKHVYLVIGGTGPERDRLEQLASQLLPERCMFLGRIADVDEYLAALDIFALPSHMEGFGLVYVEAAFHGVPSVGSNVGGIPDAVIDQKTGLLIPPGDIPALAAALAQLCDDSSLRQRLGEAARARAHAELTERIQADRYEELFRSTRPIPSMVYSAKK